MIVCLAQYNDRLASLFESADTYAIHQVQENGARLLGTVPVDGLARKDRLDLLTRYSVAMLICGALCGCDQRVLSDAGIAVKPWVCGSADDVLNALRSEALQSGALESLTMPGCGNMRAGGGMRQQGRCRHGSPFPVSAENAPDQEHDAFLQTDATTQGDIMKIAITAQGTSLESPLDPRFGRAAGFLIVDEASGNTEYRDNSQNLNLPQGAGIQAAMNVADTGARTLITGHVGPKAFMALNKGNIAVYYSEAATAAEALESFKRGELSRADAPDREGHW
ncbi:MAG: NifB/NifX family molybdenum-iron cluster-binding protein [Halodesulfovibrio sp.]